MFACRTLSPERAFTNATRSFLFGRLQKRGATGRRALHEDTQKDRFAERSRREIRMPEEPGLGGSRAIGGA